jgi:hypothetical protein
MKKIIALAIFGLLMLSCSKNDTEPYTCATCASAPEALPANDGSAKGIYKGVVVGSTGTISINIQNGSNTITATLVLDGVTALLTSTVTPVDGQDYVAPFTGTFNGSPVSITFAVGLSGLTPTVTSSDIPGHPNATFQIYKETSTSLIEAYMGTYSKTGETGVFNIVLSRGLSKWAGVAKKDGGTVVDEINGTFNNATNQIIDENTTVLGTISGYVLTGSFLNSDNETITINGVRTL